MYAAEFDYYRATSAAEAAALLKQHPGAKLLAGGHSLIPLLKLRLATPPALIDIGRIPDLKGITIAGRTIRIGALTTHAELAASSALAEHCPVLAETAKQIGDPAVRNRGTIGGNVAHADPASDLPATLTALGATFTIAGPAGTKTVEAGQFFTGMMSTILGEHDLLTTIEVPVKQANQGMAYVKFSHPASRYAVIGVAAAITLAGGTIAKASVAIGGLVPRAMRAPSVERALVGQAPSADTIARAAAAISQDLGDEILGDLYASADYRKATAPVWVKRAITSAAERARQ